MCIENSCAFTGHRELEDVDIQKLFSLIMEEINCGVNTFLCGMARGFDLLAAECVLSLKEQYPQIKLIACVPCPEQQKFYSAENKKKYENILNVCDEVRIISDHFFNGCMQLRDRYMVDNSSSLIAYVRNDGGGTGYTVSYAQKKNKKIVTV